MRVGRSVRDTDFGGGSGFTPRNLRGSTSEHTTKAPENVPLEA